jgi:hypothetical protein
MSLARYLRRAWGALPGWARWVLAVYLIGFTDGTAAHARDLARAGFHAYSGFPQVPLRVFFVSLILLDPLVVLLAALVLPAGIWLASVVMVLDIAANATGNWPRIRHDPGWLIRPAGLLLIIVFGAFVLATAPALLRIIRHTAAIELSGSQRIWGQSDDWDGGAVELGLQRGGRADEEHTAARLVEPAGGCQQVPGEAARVAHVGGGQVDDHHVAAWLERAERFAQPGERRVVQRPGGAHGGGEPAILP